MNRVASRPTSSTTSRSDTTVPARFDIFTASPPRVRFTIWIRTTCRSLRDAPSASSAAASKIHHLNKNYVQVLASRDMHPLRLHEPGAISVVIGVQDVHHRAGAL